MYIQTHFDKDRHSNMLGAVLILIEW